MAQLPQIAFWIFFVIFIVIVVRVLLMPKAEERHMEALPLDPEKPRYEE